MDLDQQLRQSAHAQHQKVIRSIEDTMGVSRSQARAVFHQQIVANEKLRLAGNAPDQKALREQQAPKVKRTEVQIVPPQVPMVPQKIPNVAGDGGDSEGTWTTAFICTMAGSVLKQVHTRDVP